MGTFGLFDDQYLVVLSQCSFGGSMVNLKEHNLWRQTATVLNHASIPLTGCVTVDKELT